MARHLRREDCVTALRASAYWVGSLEGLEGITRAVGWLQRLWAEGGDHLPLHLVHDLGHLLLRGINFRLSSTQHLGGWPERERAARLDYEDRVLGRWLLDESALRASAAINGVDEEAREAALIHGLRLALEGPLLEAGLVMGNAAFLRELGGQVTADLPQDPQGWRARGEPDEAWWGFAHEEHEAALAALPQGALFSPADLWELEHFEALPLESTRLALRTLQDLRDALPPVDTAIAGRIKRLAAEVPIEDQDSDHFPAGGFDALSSKGRMENLARSEVAYVGVEVGEALDLFDLRYVLGELLFYTRDESPLLDARRRFTFVIDQPTRLRHKLKGLPAQTLTLVEGVLLRLQQDLADIFGALSVQTRWVWRVHEAADLETIEEERRLIGLLLDADLAHRRLELETLSPQDPWPEGRGLIFSPAAPPPKRDRPEGVWIRVGDLSWILGDMGYTPLRRETLDTLLLRGLLTRREPS